MSCQPPYDHSYPLPQVFFVNGQGSQTHHGVLPNMIPTWSFPQAQEVLRRPRKSGGCMGISTRLAMLVLLLFALVFASLGLGAVWTVNLQKELKEVKRMVKAVNKSTEELARMEPVVAAQKQIGLHVLKEENEAKKRPAAHVVQCNRCEAIHNTLKWDPAVGRGFTAGGVVYREEDGALQVNQTGLYYIYCHLEFIFSTCSSTSYYDHTVFVRRSGHTPPLTLMVSHRRGFCPTEHKRSWITDSYLGSVLPLQKNDRVLVNVSHPLYVSHAHNANFFGLYKL